MNYPYDTSFDPPAPVVRLRVAAPRTTEQVGLLALIDSGADISAIPLGLMQRLHLRRVDVTSVQGFDGVSKEMAVFSVEISLEGDRALIARVIPWAETYAILGRDVMNHWRTVLDRPAKTTSIV